MFLSTTMTKKTLDYRLIYEWFAANGKVGAQLVETHFDVPGELSQPDVRIVVFDEDGLEESSFVVSSLLAREIADVIAHAAQGAEDLEEPE